MVKRPMVMITIGWMIGIIFGLYCHISIALFVMGLCFGVVYGMTHTKIKKYDKVLKIRKWMAIFLICMCISMVFTKRECAKYEEKNQQMKKGTNYMGVIVSNPVNKKSVTQYKLQIKKVEGKTCNVMVFLRIKQENNLEYGDEISFIGEYQEPSMARNEKGFDNKQYLQSIGIVGSVTTKKVQVLKKNEGNPFEKLACQIQKGMEEQIRKKLPNKNHQDVLLGILLGNDDEMEKEQKENFRKSSLSHILAVSGMHVAYLVMLVDWCSKKMKIGKRKEKGILVFVLAFFMLLTNRNPFGKTCMYHGNFRSDSGSCL